LLRSLGLELIVGRLKKKIIINKTRGEDSVGVGRLVEGGPPP
jgi:hypothetical protein